MTYKKFKLKFNKRDKMLAELDHTKVKEVVDKTDLLFDKKHSELFYMNPEMAIKNVISFNINEYKSSLQLVSKHLDLTSNKEVLRLLLERDKKTLKTAIEVCTEIKREYILTALVMYSNIVCFRKKELVLLINEKEYEEIKDLKVHYFFKVYNNSIVDERMKKYPSWYYFARLISQ